MKELLIGCMCGIPLGIMLYWLKDHRAQASSDLEELRLAMAEIRRRLEDVLNSLSKSK